MLEHWQHIALGALCTTPIMGVLWSTARGWRLSYAQKSKDLADAQQWANAMIESFERQGVFERRLTANLTERLERIAAQATPHSNATVKRMVRIAKGEE